MNTTEHSTGQKEVFAPNTTYYDMYMGRYHVFRAFRNGNAWEGSFCNRKFIQRAILLK